MAKILSLLVAVVFGETCLEPFGNATPTTSVAGT